MLKPGCEEAVYMTGDQGGRGESWDIERTGTASVMTESGRGNHFLEKRSKTTIKFCNSSSNFITLLLICLPSL